MAQAADRSSGRPWVGVWLMLSLSLASAGAMGAPSTAIDWTPDVAALETGWSADSFTTAVLTGPDDSAYGTAMVVLPDLDGDGLPEVAIGAPADGAAGAVWIHRGADIVANSTATPWQRLVVPGTTEFGRSLATDVDLDRDGEVELYVSASGSVGQGQILGWSLADLAAWDGSGTPPPPVFEHVGQHESDDLGRELHAHDADGDGWRDLIASSLTAVVTHHSEVAWQMPPTLTMPDDDITSPRMTFEWVTTTGNSWGLSGADDGWDWSEGTFGQVRPWATDGAHLFARQPLSGSVGDGPSQGDASVLEVRLGPTSAGADGPSTPQGAVGGHLESGAWGMDLSFDAAARAALDAGATVHISLQVEVADTAHLLGISAGTDATCEALARIERAASPLWLTAAGVSESEAPLASISGRLGAPPSPPLSGTHRWTLDGDDLAGQRVHLALGARSDQLDGHQAPYEGCRVRYDDVDIVLEWSGLRSVAHGRAPGATLRASDSGLAVGDAAGAWWVPAGSLGHPSEVTAVTDPTGRLAADGWVEGEAGWHLERPLLRGCDFETSCITGWTLSNATDASASVVSHSGAGWLELRDQSGTAATSASLPIPSTTSGQLNLILQAEGSDDGFVLALMSGGEDVAVVSWLDGDLTALEPGLLTTRTLADGLDPRRVHELVVELDGGLQVWLDGRSLGSTPTLTNGSVDEVRLSTTAAGADSVWWFDHVEWRMLVAAQTWNATVLGLPTSGLSRWHLDGAGLSLDAPMSTLLGLEVDPHLTVSIAPGATFASVRHVRVAAWNGTNLDWSDAVTSEAFGLAGDAGAPRVWMSAAAADDGRGVWRSWDVSGHTPAGTASSASTWRHGLVAGQGVAQTSRWLGAFGPTGVDHWIHLERGGDEARLLPHLDGNQSGRASGLAIRSLGTDLGAWTVVTSNLTPNAAPGDHLGTAPSLLVAQPTLGQVSVLRLGRGLRLDAEMTTLPDEPIAPGPLVIDGEVESVLPLVGISADLFDGLGRVVHSRSTPSVHDSTTLIELDLSAVPEGRYRLRLAATDTTGIRAEQWSERFVIGRPGENLPPTLDLELPLEDAFVDDDRLLVRGQVSDGDDDVVTVAIRLDGGVWLPAILDEPTADGWRAWSLWLDTAGLGPGTHTIDVRASDPFLEVGDLVSRRVHRPLADDGPPTMTLDLDHGPLADHATAFTGTVTDASGITGLEWRLLDGDRVLAAGDLLTSLQIEGIDPDGRTRLGWSLPFQPAFHAPCTCVFEVTARSASGLPATERRLLFLDDGTRPLDPGLLLRAPTDGASVAASIDLAVVALTPDGEGAEVEAAVLPGRRPENECPTPAAWQEVQLDSTPSVERSGSFVPLDADDGWITLVVAAVDDADRSTPVCRELRRNAEDPVAILEAPDNTSEADGTVLLDASASTDPGWGRTGLRHVWQATLPDGSQWSPEDADSAATLDYPVDRSGLHRISLRVVDEDGRSSRVTHELLVANVDPQIAVDVDGRRLAADETTVRLRAAVATTISAIATTDTAGDRPHLTFSWTLDGTLVSAQPALIIEPAQGRHDLRLVVTDDDGARDWRNLSLEVVDGAGGLSEADGAATATGWLLWVAALAAVVGLAVLALRQRGGREDSPEWRPTRGQVPSWSASRASTERDLEPGGTDTAEADDPDDEADDPNDDGNVPRTSPDDHDDESPLDDTSVGAMFSDLHGTDDAQPPAP